MLREIDPHLMKPDKSGLNRRWFKDTENDCDLFIWTDHSGMFRRFQCWLEDVLLEWHEGKRLRTGNTDQKTGGFVNLQAASFTYHNGTRIEVVNSVREFFKIMQADNPELNSMLNTIINIIDDEHEE